MKALTPWLAGIAVALLGTVNAGAQNDTPTPAVPDCPRPHLAQQGRFHAEIMAIYDANQDGKLDDDERAVLLQDMEDGLLPLPPPMAGGPGGPRHRGPPPEIVAQYDANKDGVLDADERAVLHADIEAGKVQLPRMHGRGPMGPPPEILEKYDTNGDGQLDADERAVLHQDIIDGKLPPPPHRPGGRGLQTERTPLSPGTGATSNA
jgi:EF hand